MQCIATHLVSNGEKRIYTGVALACGVYVSAKDAEDDVLNLPVKKKRKEKKRSVFITFIAFIRRSQDSSFGLFRHTGRGRKVSGNKVLIRSTCKADVMITLSDILLHHNTVGIMCRLYCVWTSHYIDR